MRTARPMNQDAWMRDYWSRFTPEELEAKGKFHAADPHPFYVGLRNIAGPALVLWGIIIVIFWKVTR